MLLALPNVGLERMGRKNSSGYAGIAFGRATRAKPKNPKTQKPKKPKNPKTHKSSGRRPPKFVQVAAVFPAHSGQPAAEKKTVAMPGGMPGKDRGTGCTLRSVGVSGFFQQGNDQRE